MNKTDFLISIIVPTYNRGKLLLKTLDSLLNQDMSAYEVLVIDDGSTDHTEDIVKALGSQKLKYFKIPNSERGAARNFGTQKARGKYVNFFDSDDIADDNHCSLASGIIEEHPDILVFALSYRIMNELGETLSTRTLTGPVKDFIFEGNHLSCNGIFIRRDVALDNPFSNNRALSGSEDYELWLRLAARFEFPCFPDVSHAVIHHQLRSTLNFDPQPLIQRKKLMVEKAFEDSKVQEVFGHKKNVIDSSAHSYIALHLAMSGASTREVLTWLKKAFLRNPRSLLSRRTAGILKHLILKKGEN